jgi:hypothetical protein
MARPFLKYNAADDLAPSTAASDKTTSPARRSSSTNSASVAVGNAASETARIGAASDGISRRTSIRYLRLLIAKRSKFFVRSCSVTSPTVLVSFAGFESSWRIFRCDGSALAYCLSIHFSQ